MSSAGIQKLLCGIYSTFKCSFDEFVGEKVFSLSYSSAILAPPPGELFFIRCIFCKYFLLIYDVSFYSLEDFVCLSIVESAPQRVLHHGSHRKTLDRGKQSSGTEAP